LSNHENDTMLDRLLRTLVPRRGLATGALVVLLLALTPSVARAGMGDFFNGLASRDRVIQISAVAMIVGIIIIMKKFDGDGPGSR
jgi:hypothetical protein